MHRLLFLACVFAVQPASGVGIIIANGLAPPHPENVIDADDAYDLSDGVGAVYVRNVGCDANETGFCANPGPPTTVELVDGGSVWGLDVLDTSLLRILGGVVNEELVALGNSTLEISGGSVASHLNAFNEASVTLSGGTIGGFLVARDDSVITIIGSGFAVDGVPINFGTIEATSGVLTGMLASGELIDNPFRHNGFNEAITGTIHLIPEPGTCVLAAIGMFGLAAGRRRRRT